MQKINPQLLKNVQECTQPILDNALRLLLKTIDKKDLKKLNYQASVQFKKIDDATVLDIAISSKKSQISAEIYYKYKHDQHRGCFQMATRVGNAVFADQLMRDDLVNHLIMVNTTDFDDLSEEIAFKNIMKYITFVEDEHLAYNQTLEAYFKQTIDESMHRRVQLLSKYTGPLYWL